jgi:hypothetical protein
MKITVLHGDHTAASRQRLIEIIQEVKKRGWEVIKDIPIPTASLFAKERLFVVEDISLIKDLKFESDFNLLVWHHHQLPARFKKIFPKNTKYEGFKIPQKLWSFLDSLRPGNARVSLALLREVAQTEPVEFVLAMISRTFRDLYWITINPETIKLPSWRLGKLKRQAGYFKPHQLKKIIHRLAAMDISVKTGAANLVHELDLFILTQLE